MKIRDGLKLGMALLAVLALATVVPTASAAVVGHLDFGNCGGGGVVVTFNLIDFQLPPSGGANPNNGCIQAGLGTLVTFDTGTVTPTSVGTVNDLNNPAFPNQNIGFIAFPTVGTGVFFDLASIGPGFAATTNCAGLTVGNACAAAAGSPFLLTLLTGGQTEISLNVAGLATDSTSANSAWQGAFTTQISDMTPAQIQATICGTAGVTVCNGIGGGSISSTYSFDGFSAAGVPEPVSMALIGGGLIGLAVLRRRKSRA
jgi:hypothetical protein